MREIEHTLIHNARQFINGANVHAVKTWIFCYEFSAPNSEPRARYEGLLRDFVAKQTMKRVGFARQNRTRGRG